MCKKNSRGRPPFNTIKVEINITCRSFISPPPLHIYSQYHIYHIFRFYAAVAFFWLFPEKSLCPPPLFGAELRHCKLNIWHTPLRHGYSKLNYLFKVNLSQTREYPCGFSRRHCFSMVIYIRNLKSRQHFRSYLNIIKTKDHHIITKDHHIIMKDHHIIMKDHHIIMKDHIMIKDHHIIMKDHIIIIDQIIVKDHHIITKDHHIIMKDHIITKDHHIITKDHHIITKDHHIITKDHHIITKDHHMIMKDHKAVTACHTLSQQM